MKSTEVHMKFLGQIKVIYWKRKKIIWYWIVNLSTDDFFIINFPQGNWFSLDQLTYKVKSSNNADTFIFGSPEIKALVSFSGYVFSGVFLFVCLSVRKPFKFSTFSLEPLGTKRSTKHYWVKEIQVCYMRVMSFFKGR